MKLRDTIERLQFILDSFGDLDMVNVIEHESNYYLQYDKCFELIQIPTDKGPDLAVGFLEKELTEEEEPEKKPNLTIVKEENDEE